MRRYRLLAVLPPLFMLGGLPYANRVQPYVLGLPFLLAWIVIWVILISLTMGLIFALDSARDANAVDAANAADAVPIIDDQSHP